jgi:ABC-type polysaccharide/polyol phosphate export permease
MIGARRRPGGAAAGPRDARPDRRRIDGREVSTRAPGSGRGSGSVWVCYNAPLAGGYGSVNTMAKVHPLLAPWVILSNFVHKIWLQHDLIRNFVVRDLRARYVGSFMGFFWSVIHPIVLLTSYYFVFKKILRVETPEDAGTTSFALFLFCSILPWLFFQDTLQRSSTVIIDNANLVTKTLFPTEILPLTVLLASLVNHVIGFVILLGIILYVLGHVSVFLLMVPVYLVLLMLFTLGLAWFVSSLNVFVRDISQVITVILTFWFWFTPIFYTTKKIPAQYMFVVRWNPMAHIVNGYRDCLLRMTLPDLQKLAVLAAASLAVFVAGGLFFRYIKREFVDVL